MARLPRLSLPGHVHHVVQRGNNRQAIFAGVTDYQHMIRLLRESARQCEVAVHAYVLMENHFHLLATPQTPGGITRMMQAVGRQYVRHFNQTQQRSGTLWEGRFRSTLIQPDTHLLASMVYLDLNPVRAGLVATAGEYAWSSHGHYIGRRADPLITPHALFWTLGNTPFAREDAYARCVREGLAASQAEQIREAALKGWALGDSSFVQSVQQLSGRRVSKSAAGRPRRVQAAMAQSLPSA
jgi:putative transposase